jgi:tetratricopeptide (TPR) repeat protein
MLLATVVLSAALAPAAPLPVAAAPQDPPATADSEAIPAPEEAPAPPMGLEGFDDSTEAAPAPTVPEEPTAPDALEASEIPAPPSGAVQDHIDAGLKAFVRGRFSSARAEFEKAYEAAPDSAATAFYLGYACYKLGEPSLRMNDDKQKARELFAKAYRLDPTFQPVWGQKAPPAPTEK